MFNTNLATVSEKLGLDNQVRELKFGASFNSGNKGQQAFHTIKYDFKPASVDRSKTSTLEINANKQVAISMPHYDANSNTVFKGSTRPYAKECVLIIDHNTGTFTLEKLTENVAVKKTRQDLTKPEQEKCELSGALIPSSTSKSSVATASRPAATDTKVANLSVRNEHKSPHRPYSTGSSSQNLHTSPSATIGGRLGPTSSLSSVRQKLSPKRRNSPSNDAGQASASSTIDVMAANKQIPHQQGSCSSLPSLTSIEDLLIVSPSPLLSRISTPPPATSTRTMTASRSPDTIQNPISKTASSVLSDSSSDSSSSSSSDDDDDDDDSSSLSDMDLDVEQKVLGKLSSSPPVPERETPETPPVSTTMSMPSLLLGDSSSQTGPTMSMPSLSSHLLNEDLQLSESGSDSD